MAGSLKIDHLSHEKFDLQEEDLNGFVNYSSKSGFWKVRSANPYG